MEDIKTAIEDLRKQASAIGNDESRPDAERMKAFQVLFDLRHLLDNLNK